MKIKIIIRHHSSNYKLEINNSDTLGTLKQMISELIHIDPKQQILLYNDKLLTEDKKNIKDLDIKEDSIIFIREEKHKKGFLSNPEHLKSMMDMMPHMKEEFNDNPQLKAMINNPSFQEEMMNMSGDPNYLKEQMKNFDLTVSRLENMPGGFNIINSMMKDVQDPMLEAFLGGMKNNYKEGGHIKTPIYDPLPGKSSKQNLLLKYREELALLRAMGFENSKNNLSALVECKGDVDETIDYLKNKSG